jgi:hypothetical protein
MPQGAAPAAGNSEPEHGTRADLSAQFDVTAKLNPRRRQDDRHSRFPALPDDH